MVVEAVTSINLGQVKSHRTAIINNPKTGSFLSDDNSAHDFKIHPQGKGRFSVAVDNPADKSLTVAVYGMHEVDGDVGDVGTFPIGSFTVANAAKGYECVFDPFPFYLVRVTHTDVPTDAVKKTCTTYFAISAF